MSVLAEARKMGEHAGYQQAMADVLRMIGEVGRVISSDVGVPEYGARMGTLQNVRAMVRARVNERKGAAVAEQQIVRIEAEEVDGGFRITLNGQPVGPVIADEHVQPVVAWFLGYLSERVVETARRMGFSTDGIIAATHELPEKCPACGKVPDPRDVQTVVTDPCKVCRR